MLVKDLPGYDMLDKNNLRWTIIATSWIPYLFKYTYSKFNNFIFYKQRSSFKIVSATAWHNRGLIEELKLNTLVIPEVQAEGEGEFTCMASNQLASIEPFIGIVWGSESNVVQAKTFEDVPFHLQKSGRGWKCE